MSLFCILPDLLSFHKSLNIQGAFLLVTQTKQKALLDIWFTHPGIVNWPQMVFEKDSTNNKFLLR